MTSALMVRNFTLSRILAMMVSRPLLLRSSGYKSYCWIMRSRFEVVITRWLITCMRWSA